MSASQQHGSGEWDSAENMGAPARGSMYHDGNYHGTVGPSQMSAQDAKGKKKKDKEDEVKKEDADGVPRSGRACLACRKLKTKCDGAEEPPCKRCRTGGHECIFVESKRGKRPARKPVDTSLAEKFRTVEKTLSLVLSSVTAGVAPDPTALQQLQATLAEGLAAERGLTSSFPGGLEGSPDSSATSDHGRGGNHSNKRPRNEGASSMLGNRSGTHDSPAMSTSSNPMLSPMPPLARAPSNTSNTMPSPATSFTSGTGSTLGANSLSLLADASLAAEIDGRTQLTGLDPSFRLSSVTSALQGKTEGAEPVGHEKTPGLLSKGVVDAETAVELFRIFFDYAYIHLPLLDPSHNTATAVCARSPFLFTVICAVASRFHADPSLHVKCYDEAHTCFVECVANSERSIEMVQACLILTVWTNAPKNTEDRPQRAWLYFGMAVRMGLELGLFRPPAFVDEHLVNNSNKSNPWANLRDVPEAEQREALNRERTWLMVFVIDRNMSAVMGRPYQIHEAKPLLIPLHPMSLPFDLGIIAHQELQSIIGQVMDTFRDRIYGLSSASDEMPSPVVLKLFNSRMDEWRQRWCPVAGEPIANNLLFYFYSSKLFLNTFPLHTMLRNGDAVDDPACVSTTINSAKAILDLGHKYAELGVLRHCPDVNFLLLLYAAVFLIKVKASNSRFAQLVDSDELQALMLQSITDCNAATCSSKHAASTCMVMLRALFASWKAMSSQPAGTKTGRSRANSTTTGLGDGGEYNAMHMRGMATDGSSDPFSTGIHGTLAAGVPASPSPYAFFNNNAFSSTNRNGSARGSLSGTHTPSHYANGSAYNPGDSLDSFLNDTHFFNSVLVSQGADGFFSWAEGLENLSHGGDKDFTGDSAASREDGMEGTQAFGKGF